MIRHIDFGGKIGVIFPSRSQCCYLPLRPVLATTDIGNINRNYQQVIKKTDIPGTDHGQVVYVLRCNKCGNEYGSNGTQVYERKCPKCQNGEPGLSYE